MSSRILSSRLLLFVIMLIALCVPAAAQDKAPTAEPPPDPAKKSDAIAALAGRIGRHWKMTARSGTSMYDSWHWGPGRHSLRVMTDGEDAGGNPWHAIQVIYRRPDLNQVRTLSMNPYARSVSEGTVTFDGKTVEYDVDMYQIGNRRKLVLRDALNGADAYRMKLLEEVNGQLAPLVDLDYNHTDEPVPARPLTLDQPPRPSERLKALLPLLGHTWQSTPSDQAETKGGWPTGAAGHVVQSTFKWIPYTEGIYARTVELTAGENGNNGEAEHVLDTYIYHHTGANVLRGLALTSRGGVYEGDITILDDGALQADLTGYEGDRTAHYTVRFDLEQDGSLRSRAWSVNGAERSILLDVHHKPVGSK